MKMSKTSRPTVEDISAFVLVGYFGGRLQWWNSDRGKWGSFGEATVYANAAEALDAKTETPQDLWYCIQLWGVALRMMDQNGTDHAM